MSLLIHYLGWHEKYDEIISLDSPRIAKLGFYSLRKNIPMYKHQQNKNNNLIANLMIPILKDIKSVDDNKMLKYKRYKVYEEPVLDTCEEYFNLENSKICD